MSNVIQFPMNRIQGMQATTAYFDEIHEQADQLDVQMSECLAQAIALEEQSERILKMMEEMSE